jgi:hypothetical protein
MEKSSYWPYCKSSAASYISMFSVLLLSIANMTSPRRIPTFYSGAPGFAEITTTPVGDRLRVIGEPIDKPTPMSAPCVPDFLQKKDNSVHQ